MRLEREETVSQNNIDIEGAHGVEIERSKVSSQFETMCHIVKSGHQEEAFFLCDQNKLIQNFQYWMEKMGNITPCFDTSCNNSSLVLKTLFELGAKFSCQNKTDMTQLSRLGIPATDIIFDSCTKVASHLRYASNTGVNVVAFDTAKELQKIKTNSPNARLVYHLAVPSGSDQMFSMSQVSDLFRAAKDLGLQVIGVAIKTSLDTLAVYQKAVALARLVFALAKSLGHELTLFDLGEVMPMDQDLSHFEKLVESIQGWIHSQFSTLDNYESLEIIAHPSVFLVESAFSLATRVIGKRVPRCPNDVTAYVINEGVFGAFGRLLQDDVTLNPRPLTDDKSICNGPHLTCDIYGPSGHDMDKICFELPMCDLEIGHWIMFENMGSYATSMPEWENEFSGHPDQHKHQLRPGAFPVAENYWFLSKYVSSQFCDESSDNDNSQGNGTGIDQGNDLSDDEEFLSAFYQLQEIDFDEKSGEKFFTLLR